MSKEIRKIIVADDEEGIRDVFAMIIESSFNHQVFLADCAAAAIAIIEKEGEIDLILSDFNMGVDTGGDLYKYLKDNDLKIPFALCSAYASHEIDGFEDFDTDHPNNAYFQKPFSSSSIISYINKVFKDEEIQASDVETFVKINPERFMRLNRIEKTFDVYIHLSKKKFVKIINAGESENFDIIEKYIKKGVEFIYLERQQYEVFEINSLTFLFDELTKLKKSNDIEKQTEIVLDTIEAIQGLVRKLGVNERTIELIETVIVSIEETISKNTKLDDLLNFLQSKNGYIKDQSYLTSYLACAIADRMSWKTEGVWKKIIMASLFQNLSLDSEREAKLFDTKSEEYLKMDERTRTRVNFHPQDAIKILSDIEGNFSEDIFKMIQNHHELPDGSGFPRGLDSRKVTPLEALFILSTNFAHTLMVNKDVNQVAIVAQDYNEKFNKGNYKRPYQGFLKAFLNLGS